MRGFYSNESAASMASRGGGRGVWRLSRSPGRRRAPATAAWLHDIGYAPELAETGFPPTCSTVLAPCANSASVRGSGAWSPTIRLPFTRPRRSALADELVTSSLTNAGSS
ncbi:hypothetical protein HBB16_13325 [Pseudonocardia sp. MCCB 268]|nr:hypothetical protein [Pseudonocardia cytotoxica]